MTLFTTKRLFRIKKPVDYVPVFSIAARWAWVLGDVNVICFFVMSSVFVFL